mmetsp:Transcript_42168/g.83844  ORF Transcript_42168/g.83844 Transcript_42168/m.83844 type:complete len:90 (-) Transcript_42168:46-315(-)
MAQDKIIVHKMAGNVSMINTQMNAVVMRLEAMPTPNDRKTVNRCVYMPSTALTMDPSGPRKAKPVPMTVTHVVIETQRRFATSVIIQQT